MMILGAVAFSTKAAVAHFDRYPPVTCFCTGSANLAALRRALVALGPFGRRVMLRMVEDRRRSDGYRVGDASAWSEHAPDAPAAGADQHGDEASIRHKAIDRPSNNDIQFR
ncbi:hypothetical protein ACVIGV_005174 [Rhizobium leguminosarum]